MTEEVHDTSHLDRYLQTRQRVSLLNASWKPALAGAGGAAVVIACAWVAMPKFTIREVVVDHVVQHDVPFDNHVPQDKPFDNYVPQDRPMPGPSASAVPGFAPRTSEEWAFVSTKGWREAVIRGRILRPDENGFILMTDQGEQGFYPAKTGTNGKPENDPSVVDVVAPYLSDLAYCRPSAEIGIYVCFAQHAGKATLIRQVPITAKEGRPT